MSDPKRWRESDSGVPDGARALLKERWQPRPMSAQEQARGAHDVARMAVSSATNTAWRGRWFGFTAITVGLAGLLLAVTHHRAPTRLVRPSVLPIARPAPAPLLAPSALPAASALPTANEPAVPAPASAYHAPVAHRTAPLAHAPLVAAHAPTPSETARDAGSAAPAPPVDALEREVALIRRAEASLTRDPAASLAMLEQYDSEFPHGELVQQREWVAIQALVHLGRTAEARTRASAALERFPTGMYTRQLRQLLDEAH